MRNNDVSVTDPVSDFVRIRQGRGQLYKQADTFYRTVIHYIYKINHLLNPLPLPECFGCYRCWSSRGDRRKKIPCQHPAGTRRYLTE